MSRHCARSPRRGSTQMSGFDIFAWIVLIVLVACTVGGRSCSWRCCPASSRSAAIIRMREAVNVAGWVTFFFGFVFWPLAVIWACLDIPSQRGRHAMIVVLLNVYLVLLFILVKMKIVPFNLFWKISPVIVFLAAALSACSSR